MSSRKKPLDLPSDRPLDALLPGLSSPSARLDSGPAPRGTPAVHPRVLEVRTEDGYDQVFVCWEDPGGARALHTALRKIIEATLLHELTQPPARGASVLGRPLRGLRLLCFADVPGVDDAVRAFGLRRSEAHAPAADADILRVLREEAAGRGTALPDRPVHTFHVPVQGQPGSWGEKLATIQSWMVDRMGEDVWGNTPGGPSRLLATYLKEEVGEAFQPDLDGLDRMEFLLVPRETGVIRWIQPLLFQALCDFVGVVLRTALDVETAWAICEPEEDGLIPPPLFRLRRGGQVTHLPIGPHVLRWCIMPLFEGEDVPPLSSWLRDEFGT